MKFGLEEAVNLRGELVDCTFKEPVSRSESEASYFASPPRAKVGG